MPPRPKFPAKTSEAEDKASLNEAYRFILMLRSKLITAGRLIGSKDRKSIEILKHELVMYSGFVDVRCARALGAQSTNIKLALDNFTAEFVYQERMPKEMVQSIKEKYYQVAGTIKAAETILSARRDGKLKMVIGWSIAALGVIPAIALPELTTFAISAGLMYFGISGSAANALIAAFRRNPTTNSDSEVV